MFSFYWMEDQKSKKLYAKAEINWLYKAVDECCVEDVAKKVAYKAINESKNKLLEKASELEELALDHYTIHQISESKSVQSGIDHYKLLNSLNLL